MLGQSLLQLRRAQRALTDAIEESEKPEQKAACASALCRVIEQRRVLLRLPGPPAGKAMDERAALAVQAQAQAVVEAEPVGPEAAEAPAPTASASGSGSDGGD